MNIPTLALISVIVLLAMGIYAGMYEREVNERHNVYPLNKG